MIRSLFFLFPSLYKEYGPLISMDTLSFHLGYTHLQNRYPRGVKGYEFKFTYVAFLYSVPGCAYSNMDKPQEY